MPELADIFHRYGPEYRAKFGSKMLPSHVKAMWDIENCRTENMDGQVYLCEDCGEMHYSYHSCQNRHCPKCMNDRTDIWLEKQRELLIPTHYHLSTFTLPEELRNVTRSNQKLIYGILFRTSAAAMKKLAADPRFVGGLIGMMGVLHTWTRANLYHPHVHYIVPGGGFDIETGTWKPSSEKFLVPVKALSVIFRAKFRDELKKTDLYDSVDPAVWHKDWVVHSKPVGNAESALKYLAPYVYRVAISNNRIVKLENDQVTFRYRESDTGKWKLETLPAMEFIRRFLQHVLPKGFIKIRYYGFLSPKHKDTLCRIKYLLGALFVLLLNHSQACLDTEKPVQNQRTCPTCGGKLILIGKISSYDSRGPPV